ncbi:hypothetical protein KKI90_21800 [Xenorhabdus bovienii]|uniref:transcriptional antitermination N peptide n=1 Tax=Xenorhabdus bovienii TaxID=40576 RepID=UPI00237C85B2|nr:hypothetical protein [Xenorhabdus bovienii]MDE1488913.1 hypothetical protein [Xenorhabdus bovienii]MDE9479870.1 hypothetical protein [Xenorhabdus bovienii]MDE9532792.1 hypothetical protein [Xenorhabdus bovienii]MDE9536808.1 hypothetical protein [Xenorhabdus bovienii]
MTTIIMKQSCKPEYLRGNAANRRHARRKVVAMARETVEDILNDAWPEQKDPKKERPVLSFRTKSESSFNNTCLPNVALYSTKQRANRILESGGVTARA